jgi:hypothetical protein
MQVYHTHTEGRESNSMQISDQKTEAKVLVLKDMRSQEDMEMDVKATG